MNKKSDKGSPSAGVKHFLQFMYDGQPEWSLFAVKAPIDEVTSAFAKFTKAKNTKANVPLKPAGETGDELGDFAAIVQLKNSPWTVVFRSIYWVSSPQLEAVPREAKELSTRLKTRAITFIGEDTSGAIGYELFENGKSLEEAIWAGGEGFSTFKSTLREQPDDEEADDDFADKAFRQEGIYIPACYPKSEDGQEWLAIDKLSAGTISRADLVEL
jgi:hypothetical protein